MVSRGSKGYLYPLSPTHVLSRKRHRQCKSLDFLVPSAVWERGCAVQDTSNAIWAMAKLNHHPGKDMLQGVAFYAIRHWPQMKPSEVVKTLGALAQLSGCPAATWEPLLAKLSAMNVSSFPAADLQQIYQMYLLMKASRAPFTLHSLSTGRLSQDDGLLSSVISRSWGQ
jgi:hypothetical protein